MKSRNLSCAHQTILVSTSHPSFALYIYIYEEGSSYNIVFFHFRSPNRRSKPLDVISTIKCAWRPNFTFFGIFLLFIKYLTKSVYSDH